MTNDVFCINNVFKDGFVKLVEVFYLAQQGLLFVLFYKKVVHNMFGLYQLKALSL